MAAALERRDWMGMLARAPAARLKALWSAMDAGGEVTWLRPPEVGAVMVRGRAGATGAPFNLGEMTVTRCALQLPCGTVGHGYVQGRDKAQAEVAARVDALMQTEAAERVRVALLDPLAAEMDATARARAEKAAATKVEFFTMARGED